MNNKRDFDLGDLPEDWGISDIQNETEFVTDYVANGSFESLAENVKYKDEPDYAILIRLTDFNNGFNGNFIYVDEHAYNFLSKSKLYGGEIIISNVGAYSGTTFFAPKLNRPMTLGPNSIMMNFKNGNGFYFYWFRSRAGKFLLDGIISGSAQPKFNKTEFRKLKIPVPSLPEQKNIATFLGNLDDKIDLLHRQNKTLEAMAETMFREWFNREDCSGTISQLITIQNGFAFKSKDFNEQGEHGVLKIKNISGSIVDIKNTGFINATISDNTPERFKVNTGDILIAMTGAEIGKLGVVPKTDKILWLNQRVGLLSEKYKGAKYLAYLQLKSEFGQDYIQNTSTGSAQPNISGTGIEGCGFPFISEDKIKEYSSEVDSFYEKLIFNLGQIRTLETIRDKLLPKLMSGEVRARH